jgi:hypothetical protein
MEENKCCICETPAPANKAAARLEQGNSSEECNFLFIYRQEVEKFDLGEMEKESLKKN